MMNFVTLIPENLGWCAVGFALALLMVMVCKIGAIAIDAIKMRYEDEEIEWCEE